MKNLRKIALAALVLVALVLALTPVFADNGVVVYVTIANGDLKLVNAQITVTDADNDGTLSINDALLLAHDKYFEGGAEAGYATEVSQYGLGLAKLWGVENDGGYSYYINNASPLNLSNAVTDGDCVYAFVFTDTTAWSDTYCYFDKTIVDAAAGEEIELTLCELGFDLDWNTIAVPVEGATVTVDGTPVNTVTDAEGKIKITINEAGAHTVSASKDGHNLVPPVCTVNVTAATETGDALPVLLVLSLIASAAFLTAAFRMRRKAVR